jgi:hypothetical protein
MFTSSRTRWRRSQDPRIAASRAILLLVEAVRELERGDAHDRDDDQQDEVDDGKERRPVDEDRREAPGTVTHLCLPVLELSADLGAEQPRHDREHHPRNLRGGVDLAVREDRREIHHRPHHGDEDRQYDS